jgi:hypothetical protein
MMIPSQLDRYDCKIGIIILQTLPILKAVGYTFFFCITMYRYMLSPRCKEKRRQLVARACADAFAAQPSSKDTARTAAAWFAAAANGLRFKVDIVLVLV